MAIPKVKVTFDADLSGLKQGTREVESDLTNFDKGLAKFGAAAKAAFAAAAAAAAAYAVKLGVDGVKAAIEDEQAQSRLAQTLKSATGATEAQIAATEKYVTKMQLATGVADTDLRSALGRLSLSTNDLGKSQELLSLALDISKARGLSLESVANALGKAYDGQNTSLAKLGIGLSSAELKTMSFSDTQKRLSDLFGGAAAANANTFQGKIDILKQRFAEFQEGIGAKLLPVLMTFFDFIEKNLIPAFQWLKANAIDPVLNAINRNKDAFIAFGEIIGTYIVPLLGGAFAIALKVVANLAGGVVDILGKVASGIMVVVNGAISGINALINLYNAIPFLPDVPTIPKISAPTVSVPKVSTASVPNVPSVSVPSLPTLTTKSIASSASSGAPSASGATPFSQPMSLAGQVPIVVNVSGAIDPEGTARTIVNTLNNSFYRGTGGAGGLVT